MSKFTEFHLEMQKLRHRRIPILFFLTFLVITAWMSWCLKDWDGSKTNDAAAMIFMNLLLMNTILCPVVIAALASRMCDMEQMGDTYKWLCTIQKPENIYRGKVITGCIILTVFNLAQVILAKALIASCETAVRQNPAVFYLTLFLTLFLTSLCIFVFQLNLSLRFSNQLTPVFISIGGTFAGLFSWFLVRWPLRYLIPWGYYAALCSTGYEYDETLRFTTYYWERYPLQWAAVLLAVTAGLYGYGWKHFLETVQNTM